MAAYDIQGETISQGIDTGINTGAKTYNLGSNPNAGLGSRNMPVVAGVVVFGIIATVALLKKR